MCLQGDGSSITVEPGLIGGEVNRILAHHHKKHKTAVQYKIGPDPSSIDSCMVGGIIANNSSGMCCGVSQNTYHTLQVRSLYLCEAEWLLSCRV
jgi:D-lactate dehydrogenase